MPATSSRVLKPPPGARHDRAPGGVVHAGAGAFAVARAARAGLVSWAVALRSGRAAPQGGPAQPCVVFSRGHSGAAPPLGARNLRGVLPDLAGSQLAVVCPARGGAAARAAAGGAERAGGRHPHHHFCPAFLRHGRRGHRAHSAHPARLYIHFFNPPRSGGRRLVHGRAPALWRCAHAQPGRWRETHHFQPAQGWAAVPAVRHGLWPRRVDLRAFLWCANRNRALTATVCTAGAGQGDRHVHPPDTHRLRGRDHARLGGLSL